MKKIPLIVLGVVILAIGGFILVNRDENKTSGSETIQTSSLEYRSTKTTGMGDYLDYNPEIIAKTSGTKILFFHASWCTQCRALEADIKRKGVPEGVSIIKVDYDSNQALRQKYGVTIQTTLVKVDDNGNLIVKYVAYDEPSLEALKTNLL